METTQRVDSYVLTPGTNLELHGPALVYGYSLRAAAADVTIDFYKDTADASHRLWPDTLDFSVEGLGKRLVFPEDCRIGVKAGEVLIVATSGAGAVINLLARCAGQRSAQPV